MSFAEQYGPWALVAGASEGTGRAFAREIAALGLRCILVARREAPLAELAREIHEESGVDCVTAAIDLAAPDAFEQLLAAVGTREVGLYVANAGADPNGARFLDRDADVWLSLVRRNVEMTLRCCHHFGRAMRERRRGGLLLVGSGAGYGGGSMLATYSGTKAFELCFAESLWAELRPHNVHVLCLMLNITDTPALRQLVADKGRPVPRSAASPDDVASVGLANLSRGPVYNWGQKLGLGARWRRTRVRIVDVVAKQVLGD